MASRRDISSDAKLLHAALVSMVRRSLTWSQVEIAAELGWDSRQRVWRATCELVAVDLLAVRRVGLGRPNEYLLKPTADIGAEDIAARAPKHSGSGAGHQEVRRPNTPARAFHSEKKNERKGVDIRSKTAADYYQTSSGDRLVPRT